MSGLSKVQMSAFLQENPFTTNGFRSGYGQNRSNCDDHTNSTGCRSFRWSSTANLSLDVRPSGSLRGFLRKVRRVSYINALVAYYWTRLRHV
jgi:hypothetical protein